MSVPPRFRLKEGWSTLFLLWAMLLVASSAIAQTNLIDGLRVVSVAATAGMFAGLALAKSSFKDRTAHLYGLVYGLFVVAYLIGIILPGDLVWRERVFEIISRQGGVAVESGQRWNKPGWPDLRDPDDGRLLDPRLYGRLVYLSPPALVARNRTHRSGAPERCLLL